MFTIEGHPTMARARSVNDCALYLRGYVCQNVTDNAFALAHLRPGAALTFAVWHGCDSITVTRVSA